GAGGRDRRCEGDALRALAGVAVMQVIGAVVAAVRGAGGPRAGEAHAGGGGVVDDERRGGAFVDAHPVDIHVALVAVAREIHRPAGGAAEGVVDVEIKVLRGPLGAGRATPDLHIVEIERGRGLADEAAVGVRRVGPVRGGGAGDAAVHQHQLVVAGVVRGPVVETGGETFLAEIAIGLDHVDLTVFLRSGGDADRPEGGPAAGGALRD